MLELVLISISVVLKKIAFHTLSKISQQILNKDYTSVKNAYASVSGLYTSELNKKWIIDIDEKDRRFVNEVLNFINRIEQPVGEKFVDLLETKNGFHLITKPFNLQEFKQQYPTIDVHKNNPTYLYSI